MENFWKGAIAPWTKHVDGRRWIPISEMTAEDWEYLAYPELHPIPVRRIQEKVIAGTLCGFHEISVDMHKAHSPHGGKPRYLFPGEEDEEIALDASTTYSEDADAEPVKRFEDEYDSYLFDESRLNSDAIKAGLTRQQRVAWPKWAIIIAVMAIKYCRAKANDELEELQEREIEYYEFE